MISYVLYGGIVLLIEMILSAIFIQEKGLTFIVSPSFLSEVTEYSEFVCILFFTIITIINPLGLVYKILMLLLLEDGSDD